MLPLLAKALKGLDYPASKLEVKLVLEEDDNETIDAAKALRLPGTFEIVRVPPSQPKTKPKACNYALQFSPRRVRDHLRRRGPARARSAQEGGARLPQRRSDSSPACRAGSTTSTAARTG